MSTPKSRITSFELLRARSHLQKFLPQAEDELKENTAMPYPMTEGYLFGIACAPEMILPRIWIPEILGNAFTKTENSNGVQEILDALMIVYNHINSCVREENRAFEAHTLRFASPPEKNWALTADANLWSTGFGMAHRGNVESWREFFKNESKLSEQDEEIKEDLFVTGFMLCVFCGEEVARSMTDNPEWEGQGRDPVKLLEMVIQNFSILLQSYADASAYFSG